MKKTVINHMKTLGAIALGFALPTMVQAADTPTLMSYQGNLLDANGDPVGNTAPVNKTVQFYVYDAEEGGNIIWGEEQTVTVDKGYFSVILGEGTKLIGDNLFQDMEPGKTDANARYIGLIVDDVDITPRLRLLTTPYSQLSQHAVSAKKSVTAQSSAISDTLANSTAARSGFGFVPVGGIIMWDSNTPPKVGLFAMALVHQTFGAVLLWALVRVAENTMIILGRTMKHLAIKQVLHL